jgi:hypothetical protein
VEGLWLFVSCVYGHGALFMIIHRRSEAVHLSALSRGRKCAAGSSVVACTAREVQTAVSLYGGVGSNLKRLALQPGSVTQ